MGRKGLLLVRRGGLAGTRVGRIGFLPGLFVTCSLACFAQGQAKARQLGSQLEASSDCFG
ncbi:MAG: hypothetical protein D6E12_09985 [Desulfovibrio sp.]|nr:MAG: hypothetical protein D6E12_09985 [Desulfovibrio sp.]